MSDVVIRAENLSKKYRIQHQQERQPYIALRDVFTDKLLLPWRWLKQQRTTQHSASSTQPSTEDFWALKDVSFEIKRGEVVGIIGRNGAGKSTLLKILSRITEPTKGCVRIRGRVASLLEVGTGFHPELTGRENIFLNGAILGMTREEIKQKFDEIVAFAEIEKFLDTPVKRYSSGMYVRLAFAVAAHLEPEILIVDEVLAVGDVEFQKKCLGKMKEVSLQGGRTVIFVSHNLAAIKSLCMNGLHLDAGQVKFFGNTESAINCYLCTDESEPFKGVIPDDLIRVCGTGEAKFRLIRLLDEVEQPVFQITTGDLLQIQLCFEVRVPLNDALIEVGILNNDGLQITQSFSTDNGASCLKLDLGSHEIRFCVENVLFPGRYSILVGIHRTDGTTVDWIERSLDFEVINSGKDNPNYYRWERRGYFRPTQYWTLLQHEPVQEMNINSVRTESPLL